MQKELRIDATYVRRLNNEDVSISRRPIGDCLLESSELS